MSIKESQNDGSKQGKTGALLAVIVSLATIALIYYLDSNGLR
ncbi:MAG: hypothetical protein SFT81_02730 [Candidatus Caenarcaniphilales bacterium]|nr:hypothetical protein [Candidatus Caenarcaniphilales bacterium]